MAKYKVEHLYTSVIGCYLLSTRACGAVRDAHMQPSSVQGAGYGSHVHCTLYGYLIIYLIEGSPPEENVQ